MRRSGERNGAPPGRSRRAGRARRRAAARRARESRTSAAGHRTRERGLRRDRFGGRPRLRSSPRARPPAAIPKTRKHLKLCQKLRRAGSKNWPNANGPRPSTTTMPPAKNICSTTPRTPMPPMACLVPSMHGVLFDDEVEEVGRGLRRIVALKVVARERVNHGLVERRQHRQSARRSRGSRSSASGLTISFR